MNNNQLWQAALGQLELKISQGNYLTWFKSTAIQKRDGSKIIIETPSAFIYEWLSKKYHGIILETLQNLDANISQIDFVISSATSQQRQIKKSFRITAHKKTHKSTTNTKGDITPTRQTCIDSKAQKLAKSLNLNYVFNTYVVGPSNEIAHAACKAVATKPGTIYNPLFIYGGVGLGKTHLLQAVGNEILKNNPSARVLYVSSERFINEFVQSIKDRTTQTFKQFYRDVDVFIIDDVQFLAGKGKTQEELFHTFNALHGKNSQLILSSDRSPRSIPTFEERLRSRLGGGMIADIKQPDYETRLAIVTKKAEKVAGLFNNDALAYIAKNFQKNVRELEGALNRVIAHCQLSNQAATLPYAKKVLSSILEQAQPRTTGSKNILEAVGLYYNTSLNDLCGKSRKKEIVKPRQIAMYLLRKENSVSFPTIGEYFGGRDHTTAMHACEKIEKLLEHDEELLQELNFIREKLYA